MAKKKRDYGLILSLGLIIAMASYWFVKEVPMDGVEHYVDLLGDKLVALIPEEKDKAEVAAIYAEFQTQVKEKKVSPENVEKVASAIINLSNASDSLSREEAEALIRDAVQDVRVDSLNLIHIPDVEATPEEWAELDERLSRVHRVDEHLKDHLIVTPERPMPQYRVDKKLNIVIDSRVKDELKEEQLLKDLEEDMIIFWKDSVAEDMERDLHKLEIELKELSTHIELQHNMIKLKVLSHPVGEDLIIALDSLDILTMVKWDSVEEEMSKRIEKFELQMDSDIVIRPRPDPRPE